MQRKKLLVLVPIIDEDFVLLKELANEYDVIKKADFNGCVEDVEIVYGWDSELNLKLVTSPSNKIKWIQAQSAGIDHIDTTVLKEQGILLSNGSGVHGNQMSESVLGMLFTYTRGIKSAVLNQEKATWAIPDKQTDLVGKKVMILGTGHIGARLAEVLKVFQTYLVGVNRSGKPVANFDKMIQQDQLDTVLSEMDIVINLLPDTTVTHHFFTEELFSVMKKGVIFINVGRGGTVKTDDLVIACQNGTIGFAGLDVFEEEPLPKESPLWQLDNCLITPHSSGMTDKYFERLFPIFKTNLEVFLQTGKISENEITL